MLVKYRNSYSRDFGLELIRNMTKQSDCSGNLYRRHKLSRIKRQDLSVRRRFFTMARNEWSERNINNARGRSEKEL